MPYRGRQNMCRWFWHTPKISRKFAGELKFDLECYDREENFAGYHLDLVQLFRGIFFQRSWHAFCMEPIERYAMAVTWASERGVSTPPGKMCWTYFDTLDIV